MAHALELACGHRPLTCPGSSRTADPTLAKPDLAGTVRAVVSGDQAAFARLYADYVRMVHAILLGRVPHRDVDDLVQEVFITAYTRIRELRNAAAFGGWLATIARNRATDYRRHARDHERGRLPDSQQGDQPVLQRDPAFASGRRPDHRDRRAAPSRLRHSTPETGHA